MSAATTRLAPVATPAERAVSAAAAMVAPISLKELNALAELQTRVDRKYFVSAGVFRQLIAQLADEMQVLEIDGRRTFGYESVYFDTPDLTTYRAHLQRRRQRFKARTRTYTDSGLCMFEVKLSGARGETVKERVPHPAGTAPSSPARPWPTCAPRSARPSGRTCRPGCSPPCPPPTGAPRSSPAAGSAG